MDVRIYHGDWRRRLIILQLIPVVFCVEQRDNNEKIVQGCVGSRLSLSCDGTKEIEVLTVVLGETDCWGSGCCIEDDDCTRNPRNEHRVHVNNSCNGRQSCIVPVHKQQIACGYFGTYLNNDFERITYRCKTRSERIVAQGCVNTRLSLSCDNTSEIEILAVVLGDTTGCFGSSCCIKDDSCTRNPSSSEHVMHVNSSCNGQRTCIVAVHKEKITCGYFNTYVINDFERITYRCKTRTGVANHNFLSVTSFRYETTKPAEYDPEYIARVSQSNPPGREDGTKTEVIVPVVMTVCITAFVAIAVIVIIVVRKQRQKRPPIAAMTARYVIGNEESELTEDRRGGIANRSNRSQKGALTEARSSGATSGNLSDLEPEAKEATKYTKKVNQGHASANLYETFTPTTKEYHEYECLTIDLATKR